MISNGMTLIKIDAYWQQLVIGLVLIFACSLEYRPKPHPRQPEPVRRARIWRNTILEMKGRIEIVWRDQSPQDMFRST